MGNIASDVKIEGTIKFGQNMQIDGNVDGKIITDTGELVVSKTGIVKATVNVKNAVIEGRVVGNIIASDKVLLKQAAHLTGDLHAKRLVIEEGVTFVGKSNVKP